MGQLRAGRGLLWLRALREDRMAAFQEPPKHTYSPTDTNTHIEMCLQINPYLMHRTVHTQKQIYIYSIHTHLCTHTVEHTSFS